MMRGWSISLLLAATAACSIAPVGQAPSPIAYTRILAPLLAAHNRERAAVGSPLLAWDPTLASSAFVHAATLAQLGRLRHSSRQQRPGQGENLWIGTRGDYTLSAMVGSWAIERRHFRPGRFPANSRTGNWAEVGHYTQMIWPGTTRLGCAIASSPQHDVLVCRYAPSGNVDGVMLGRRAEPRTSDNQIGTFCLTNRICTAA
ncbi:MAG: CAP domain-containing protein [Sphingomonas bacterium]|nr:CAP domain-containing protein [Sphingomonas bacterium]